MKYNDKPRLVGINHIALEVGDVEEALEFYCDIFDFGLRGPPDGKAFIDMGDQFLAFIESSSQKSDRYRHFGLVVDNSSAVRYLAEAAGAEILESDFLEFRDPWGNRIQVVEYSELEFIKSDKVLEAMGLDLEKSSKARESMQAKGFKM